MFKLVFSEIRRNPSVWLGSLICAFVAGYIAQWGQSVIQISFINNEIYSKSLYNAGSAILLFSAIAGAVVVSSSSKLIVDSQRASYALWQTVNLSPYQVFLIVISQIAMVALLGSSVGAIVAWASFACTFPWVFIDFKGVSDLVLASRLENFTYITGLVVAIFVLGSIRSAYRASSVSPGEVLHTVSKNDSGLSIVKLGRFLLLLSFTVWIVSLMYAAETKDLTTWAILIPFLVVVTAAPIVPCFMRMSLKLLRLCLSRFSTFTLLATNGALYSFAISRSIEMSLFVGVGVVAGVFSAVELIAKFLISLGVENVQGLRITDSLIFLGGPVLLSCVGATISIIMSSKQRLYDTCLLMAGGLSLKETLILGLLEAFIHSVNAYFWGMVSVSVSSFLIAHACNVSLLDSIRYKEGMLVACIGFGLVAVVIMISSLFTLNKDIASVLSSHE